MLHIEIASYLNGISCNTSNTNHISLFTFFENESPMIVCHSTIEFDMTATMIPTIISTTDDLSTSPSTQTHPLLSTFSDELDN